MMLSNEHWLVEYDFARRRILPDRLTRFAHAAYLDHAQRMIDAYREGVGESRRDLHQMVESILADELDCPPKRCAAFCRILDAQSVFDDGQSVDAARLRKTVFRMAARHHPLVEQKEGLFASDRTAIQTQIAKALDRPWSEIERELFVDIHECHRLIDYRGLVEPDRLLAMYNVAQTQATLAQANRAVIRTDYPPVQLVADIRRLSLPHEIVVDQDTRYEIRIERPSGKRLSTRQFSNAMGALLFVLMERLDWHLEAIVPTKTKQRSLTLMLRHDEGLKSPRGSQLENADTPIDSFLQNWRERSDTSWQLAPADSMHQHQGSATQADFVLTHDTQGMVHLEIVESFTPSLLDGRLRVIHGLVDQRWIIAVPQSRAKDIGDWQPPENCRIIPFRNSLDAAAVMATIQQLLTER